VVADVREMSRVVSEAGMGAVYRSGDVDSLAATLRDVLDHPDRFAGRLHDPDLLREYSWEHQAEGLRRLYHDLLGTPDRYAAQPTSERQ
jgi:glycosyltransferase involved in cell wall biosynthesis